MKLRVLGCDGGRGQGYYSTGLLFDDRYLIDAGTILSALTVEEALRITDIFLTHSHLDHLCELPYLLDATFGRRDEPLRVHGQRPTIDAMMAHLFNDVIWPDFSRIPAPGQGQFTLHEIEPGRDYQAGDLTFTPIQVNHVVPTVGYKIADRGGCVMFSGDTGPMTEFWRIANEAVNLKAVIVDLSFPEREHFVARISGHMTAGDVAAELRNLHQDCAVYAFHYKVGQGPVVAAEAAQIRHSGRPVRTLKDSVVLFF
jgi:ribonuclease BN (tRNA processing enzyme)